MSAPGFRSCVAASLADAPPGLRDESDREKLGIKGPRASSWLAEHGVAHPESLFAVARGENDCVVVRTAEDEVVLEAPRGDPLFERLEAALADAPSGVYRVEQQSATFVLGGSEAPAFWAQTCALDIASAPTDRIVYTRVAGTSCGVIPEVDAGTRSYRIWVDYSYGPDFWNAAVEILAGS